MNSDCISRELAIETFYYQGVSGHSMLDAIFFKGIRAIIQGMPSVEPSFVHARWKVKRCVCGEREFECSSCHKTEWRTSISQFKYCPFCMATMDGGRHWIRTPRYSHLSRLSQSGSVYRVISPIKRKSEIIRKGSYSYDF